MIYPRWLSRLYARFMGYFWLPCPVCGEDFGGHEATFEDVDGKLVCGKEKCQRYARERAPFIAIPWEKLTGLQNMNPAELQAHWDKMGGGFQNMTPEQQAALFGDRAAQSKP